jgi:RNA polymerase sigma-70 factor (ECF subfamily)
MAELINSILPAVGEPVLCPPRKALLVETSRSSADEEARRLAAGVARGDEAAFRALYDRYQQRLFRFALALTRGDESLAHEVVQSVFVTAAAKLRRAESEEHLWNWLAQVGRQQLGKIWRQRQRSSIVVGVEELPDCAAPTEPDSMLEEGLDAALRTMEPEEQQLIEWFYFDDLSHHEIAQRLEATPKAISSRLERVRAKLRVALTKRVSHET